MLPRAPKTPLGRLQGLPRHLPDAFRSAQDASRAPKRCPRRLQEHSRGLQDGSRSAQDASHTAPAALQRPPRVPKSLQDGAKSLQDASKSTQDASKSTQDASKRSPGASMEGHRVLQLPVRRPFAKQGPPNDLTTRPSCGQSLSNPTAGTAKALSSSAWMISTATDS